MKRRVVIIGGGAAGMSAAAKARRTNSKLDIIVYERSGFVSYGACGFPYAIKGEIARIEDVIVRTPEQFARQGIQALIHHEVLAIDTERQTVRVRDLTGGREFVDHWDELVLTTGGQPVRPPLSGVDLPGVFTLRNVEDAQAIQHWLHEQQPRTGVIIGGGYIGLEMAEALAAHGMQLTLIERLSQVLPGFDSELAAQVEAELRKHQVDVRLGQTVQAIGGDERVREVLVDGQSIPAEIVILAVGVRPGVALARSAGIALGTTGAVAVDDHQRTNVPHVWAAGDVAEAFHRVTGKPVWVPLGTTANKQGRVAGENLAGGDARFGGIVGTVAVKVFDLEAAMSGLSLARAQTEGFAARAISATANSRAHYMPGHQPITVSLVFDEASRRLLGGQMVGREGVAKRIDTVAAALQAGWTIDELAELDASYAPPFAPVWDPILVAANLARK